MPSSYRHPEFVGDIFLKVRLVNNAGSNLLRDINFLTKASGAYRNSFLHAEYTLSTKAIFIIISFITYFEHFNMFIYANLFLI